MEGVKKITDTGHQQTLGMPSYVASITLSFNIGQALVASKKREGGSPNQEEIMEIETRYSYKENWKNIFRIPLQ